MLNTVASTSPCRLAKNPRKGYWISYLRIVWFDYVSIAAVAASALWVHPLPMYYLEHRLISIKLSTYGDATQDLAYPFVKEPLSTWACGMIVVFVPMLVITLFQLNMRSILDFHDGFTGTLKAAAALPDPKKLLGQVWMNYSACTASISAVDKALQGFPSGHTTSACASSVFLNLYSNAKLKAFGDHASDLWVFAATKTPLLLASLNASSIYISYQHHAYEIFIGMLLGLISGVLGYRSTYAAIFDSRYNHIPLPPFGARISAAAYHPVMWNLWAQSSTTAQAQKMRLSWLRNMGCLEVIVQDKNLLLRLRKQK
ncbi:unnamed protein product [Diplocarpon coronariae]